MSTRDFSDMTDSASGVEMLDVFDDVGRHIGIKPRKEVHQSGDWHRVFHCQIVTLRDATPTLVLQRRSKSKAAFPGLLDISAAGHLAAGETPVESTRELAEELGVEADAEALILLGERRLVDDSGEGTLNKELTSVFLLRDDRPLTEYVLQSAEVDAVFDASIEELLQLFDGSIKKLELSGVANAGSPQAKPITVQVALEDFVPGSSYWVNLFVMSERFINGQSPLAI